MSANDLSRPDSLENSSSQSQYRRTHKTHRLGNRIKNQTQSALIINDGMSSREERKIKQYVQRIEEQTRIEETATLKRKRSKPNPPPPPAVNALSKESPDKALEPCEEIPIQAPVLINPQLVPQQSSHLLEEKTQTKLRLNGNINMKNQQHIFLYLSDCYDKCQDVLQKLNSTATQFYSPPRTLKPENSSLLAINQDVFQETLVLTKNLKNQFTSSHIQSHNEQREFLSRYFDKKYLETILRESRLQIYKRSSQDKQQPNGKPIQKKQY